MGGDHDPPPMWIRVRPATHADSERLVALRDRAIEETTGRRGGSVLASELTGRAGDIRGGTEGVAVAELHARDEAAAVEPAAVGYVTLQTEGAAPGVAAIRELYVEPRARTIGVGSALLEAAVAIALEHGCTSIDAVALPGDRATKNFFEDHGMVARAITVNRVIGGDTRAAGPHPPSHAGA